MCTCLMSQIPWLCQRHNSNVIHGHGPRQRTMSTKVAYNHCGVSFRAKLTQGLRTSSAGKSASEPSMAARQLRVQASLARRGHVAAPPLPPLVRSPPPPPPPLPLPVPLLRRPAPLPNHDLLIPNCLMGIRVCAADSHLPTRGPEWAPL